MIYEFNKDYFLFGDDITNIYVIKNTLVMMIWMKETWFKFNSTKQPKKFHLKHNCLQKSQSEKNEGIHFNDSFLAIQGWMSLKSN